MQLQLDIGLFRVDLAEITGQIVRLKRLLGRTWARPMAAEQRELARLKQRATELCVLRAHSRGKLHVRSNPDGARDPELYHRRIAERLGPSYAIALDQSA